MTKRAAIYVRISDDKTGERLGVQRQEQDCRDLAQARGFEVAPAPYVDNDLSAFSGRRRPAYAQLLQDVERGDIGTVLVYMTSRLWRNRRERAAGSELFMEHGVRVVPVRGPELDFSSASGRLVAHVLGEMDTHESDVKSERQQRKALELAQAGKVSGGGHRPFGYEADRVTVRESEAAVVRDMVRRTLAGESLRSIADDLNARGVKTSNGTAWYSMTLRRVLLSARIAGQREHHGEVVADAVWPAIVSKEDSARVRALLRDPDRRTSTSGPARYLLTGLLRCAKCGCGMVGRPNERGARRYVCNKIPGTGACGGTYAMAEPIETYIAESAFEVWETPGLLDARRGAAQGESDDTLYDELRAVQDDLDALASDAGAGRISVREWRIVREGLQRTAEDLERRLAHDRGSSVLYADDVRGGVRDAWPALSRDRRRALLDLVLDHVAVHPGRRGYNGFDPDRFQLVWRA